MKTVLNVQKTRLEKWHLLFEDENDLVLVLEDIFEVDDFVGVVTDGEHRDLVEDLHGAVDTAAVAGAEFCRIGDARLAVGALADRRKEAAEENGREGEKRLIKLYSTQC